MARARFKTKLSKRQKWVDVLVLLLVALASYAFSLFFMFAIGEFDELNAETLLLTLALTYGVVSMLLFPVLLIALALGLQKGRAKRIRDDSSYIPTQNIQYYRDTLEELDPSIASILIDLDLYGKKDIAAALLKMHNKKLIQIGQNGEIVLTNANKQKSSKSKSERDLITMIQKGTLTHKAVLQQWKRNRFADAERMGYLRKKKNDWNNETRSLPAFASISLLLAIVLWGLFLGNDLLLFKTVPEMLLVFGLLLVIDLLIFVPFYLIARAYAYFNREDVRWERTPQGHELAEKIAGLENFIHDFTLLSEAEKDAVIVWDDYLVYAIILEENDRVVKDISKRYNFSLHSFERLGLLRN